MLKAYKYRLYPNRDQRNFFEKTFGCVRFVYNKMLADKISSFKKSQKSMDKSSILHQLNIKLNFHS